MSDTHPPIANKVACVDFDGTIVPWGPLMEPKAPTEQVVEAMKNLKRHGYTIVIFSSRLANSWLLSEFGKAKFAMQDQMDFIAKTLDDAGAPWDYMTADKVPAEVYFDDKAIRVSKDFPLDQAITAFLWETV